MDSAEKPITKVSTFKLTVEAGKWTGAALCGLAEGGSLAVQITTTGPVLVRLVAKDPHSSPENCEELVSGEASDVYGFAITIPDSGDYYLVIDNRSGTQSQQVNIRVTASSPGHPIVNLLGFLDGLLEMVAANLRQIFAVDSLQITVEPDLLEAASSEGDHIVLGLEFSQTMFETIGEKETATSALFFTLFQEFGQLLLSRSPDSHDDSDAAMDELATALMVLCGFRDHLRKQAEFFAGDPKAQRLAERSGARNRHPLTPERARSVLEWQEDSDSVVRRWQSVVLSNLRTDVLQGLTTEAPPWSSPELVRTEIARREQTKTNSGG